MIPMKKLVFALPLLVLAGCGTSSPAPNFAPLNYSYLPPILLKVSQINVTNSYVPTPSQVQTAVLDPAPPAETLLTMLKQRLQPSGQPGTATVTVQTAYVDQVKGNLVGQMTVDVNLASADGRSTAFTEASVSAMQTAPQSDDPADMQVALYDLTKQLMTQMNVQLQYEIQKNIPTWISWANNGTAAASGTGVGVEASSLAPPPGVATVSGVAAQPASQAGSAAATSSGQAGGSTASGVPTYLPGAGPSALNGTQN